MVKLFKFVLSVKILGICGFMAIATMLFTIMKRDINLLKQLDAAVWTKICSKNKPSVDYMEDFGDDVIEFEYQASTNTNNISMTPPPPRTPTTSALSDQYVIYCNIHICSCPENYVTFGDDYVDGRGYGNQLFNLASLLYAAKLINRKPVFETYISKLSLHKVFDLKVDRCPQMEPRLKFYERKSLEFDSRLENISQNADLPGKMLHLRGFFQSWKYVRPVEDQLRRLLIFSSDLRAFAKFYIGRSLPGSWIEQKIVRVGIHVRRGDVLKQDMQTFGYTAPGVDYYNRAMDYFLKRYSRVHFIVCTNDHVWAVSNILNTRKNPNMTITHTFRTGPEKDFAVLASCDHVIMSTGTFGWWAAWLANGTTIYYNAWPRQGSKLFEMFKREDFFPSHWIPMV